MTDGVLVVDKPAGMTSHDVVDRIRRAFSVAKAGHTGTLDPGATGVLPVCVGGATRIARFLSGGEKEYRAVFRLGERRDTDDAEGNLLESRPVSVTRAQVEEALSGFRGEIEQVPPAVSAVRVGGERAYRAVRRGKKVSLAPRRVRVEIALEDFDGKRARVSVRCSAGTYVRALARDLGEALGCGGCVEALRRTVCGPFDEEAARPLEEILSADALTGIVPVSRALSFLPTVRVREGEERSVLAGVELHAGLLCGEPPSEGVFAIADAAGRILALASAGEEELRYERVLSEAVS